MESGESGQRPRHQGSSTPQQIGRYALEAELGRGGMGVVYGAFDPALGRRVALKVLLGGALADDDLVERFRREARAVARLDHPNIVRVIDLGRYHEQLFFTMDWVEGPSLATLLEEQGRLPIAEAIRIIGEVARGLEHAHRAGVVHRDIKPGNILLEPDGTPRITDFGLALETAGGSSRLTRTGQVMGTPAYMSPEQGRADTGRISARSDIYSLGAVLYQLLTGRPPHVAEGDLVVLYMAIHDPVPSPRQFAPDLPRALERICLRALERDPEDRYPSALALAEDLERFARGEPVRARRVPPAVRVGRMLRRRGRAALVAGALAAAVGAAIAAGMTSGAGTAQGRQLRQAAAEKRKEAVESRVEELTRAGRLQEADEAFEVFTRLEENWGTSALARAFLTRSERQRSLGRFDEELIAAAAAYAHARDRERRGEALLGLARAFARRWRWDQIEPILDALDAHPSRRDEAARLRALAALARRDIAAALEREEALPPEIAPLLRALGSMHQTPHRAIAATPAPTGGGGRQRLLLVDAGDRRRLIVARPESGLPLEGERRLDAPVPGDRDLHVLSRGKQAPVMLLAHHEEEGAPRQAVLYEWGDPLAPVLRWQEDALNAAAAVDVDGDGAGEIYIGLGPYQRKLFRLVERGGTWTKEAPHAATNRAESDVLALAGADLDGDGRRELAASLGPWRSFDVRVFREDATGGWDIAASRRLGFVGGLAALPGEGGDLLAATKSQVYPSADVFSPERPYGEPPGVHLLRLEGEELSRAGYAPIPFPVDAGHDIDARRLVTGDFDGDGLLDLATSPEARSLSSYALLFRRTGPTSFAPVTLGGLEVLAAIDVDDDPADELVVALPDREGEIWVLGAGKERAPALAGRAPFAPAPAPLRALAEPALLGTWHRAEELVSFGLPAEAARVFEDLARRARLPHTAAAADLRAAELWERAGDDRRAAPRFERATRDPDLVGTALEGALRAHVREHHFDRALFLARELGRRAGRAERARRAAETEALLEELVSEDAPIEIDFAAPLGGAWEILDPVALRRDARAESLRVDAFGTRGAIARLPFSWSGGRLGLEIDFEVKRGEWAAGFAVALRETDGDEEDRLGVGLFGWGGGGILRRQLGCLLPGKDGLDGPRRPVAGPAESEQVRARIELAPALGEILCVLTDGAGRELYRRRVMAGDSLAPGAYELVLERRGDPGIEDPTLSILRIDRIAIAGGVAAQGRDDPLQLGHRAVVEGDGAAALQLYDFVRDPGEGKARQRDLGRILAYGDLGMQKEAAKGLRELEAGGAALELARLLRTREREFAPLAREVLGPPFFARYLDAWRVPIFMHLSDESVRMSLTTALAGLREALPSAIGPRGGQVKMLLLRARGEAWWYRGRYAAARADLVSAAELAELLARRAREARDPEALRVAEQVLEEANEVLERIGAR